MNTDKFTLYGEKTDVLKFIMCLLVVAIHTTGYLGIFPILRCAVPMFFIISAYFFFNKFDAATELNDKPSILKRYIKRNMLLYLFWFILLLPFTIVLRGWYHGNVWENLLEFCKYFCFSSTFPVSWYIMASVIGTTLICFLSRYLNNAVVFVISLLSYLFCCLSSNYGTLIQEGEPAVWYEYYRNIFTSPYNSFPVSLIWIWLGRWIAGKQETITKMNAKWLQVALIICFALLYVEYAMIAHYNLSVSNDCYIMLLPVCVLFILVFGKMKFDIKPRFDYRKTCTIVFCCHCTIATILRFTLQHFGYQMDILVFFITTAAALTVSFLVLKLETKYKILKYAY